MNRDLKLSIIHKLFYKNTIKDLWFKIITEQVKEHYTVLEIGSGSGRGKQNKNYPNCKKIIGIDLDSRVLKNPYLNESYNINAYEIDKEFKKNTKFDLIYSNMVAEHIENAEKFITTQISSLNPNGSIIHSTVSKYYWTSILNNFVSKRFKNFLIKKLGSGRNPEDIFPTYYKLNCRKDVLKICNKYSLDVKFFHQDEPPGYLRRSIILMVVYTIIHKPLQYFFLALRPTFIFKIQKK